MSHLIDVPEGVVVKPSSDMSLPFTVTAHNINQSMQNWCIENIAWIDICLEKYGAVLFRNFSLGEDGQEFSAISTLICGELLPYVYRSTPRTSVGANVYTATEYSRTAIIPQHNENAYTRNWPMRLAFHCVQAASQGGETPLSSNRAVTSKISPKILEKFRRLGVMYVRNYSKGLDLPWNVVFQTESRDEVERFCNEASIAFEWADGDRLTTRQVCQGTAHHPRTGEELWFNQAHLFHASSLDPATFEAMMEIYSVEELPRHAFYGDGTEIESGVLEEIRTAFDSEKRLFSWHANDVLLIDNMAVAHGRLPFQGPRRVLVAMGGKYNPPQ